MADTKALFTQRFDAARTAWTRGDASAAAEFLHSAISAARSDPGLRRELASALFNLGKLSRKLGDGGEAQAGPLLTEALAISEGLFGSEHAALAPVLHELSRLHLQQSQHARAEEVLERLLAIARLKGEDHPDVGAALSELAFVKRKLGDDVSAEALYRGALRIQEKALGPNHMLVIGTLERLSETCAARGDFAEALGLLRRALPAREAALGAGHERVRAAQSRVAKLEMQLGGAAGAAGSPAATAVVSTATKDAKPAPTPLERVADSPADRPRTRVSAPVYSKDLELLGGSDSSMAGPAPDSREVASSSTVATAAATGASTASSTTASSTIASSTTASSTETTSASQIVVALLEKARAFDSVTDRESRVAHRDVVLTGAVLDDVASANAAEDDPTLGDWRSMVAPVPRGDSAELPRKKRTALYASAGVAAVAIAMAGVLVLRPRAGSGELVATQTGAAQHTNAAGAHLVTAPATRTASTGIGAAGKAGAAHTDSAHLASATPAPPAAAVHRAEDGSGNAPRELRAPRVDVHLDSRNIPSMPAAPSGDAILRSAIERQRASDTDRAQTKDAFSHSTAADAEHAHTSPRIIGRPPEPEFPDALLRTGTREGQVTVRFMVDELGRVDVSSIVVEQSDHELFTAAVRDILPRFRFEPAHTFGLASKPVAAWVSVPFRFTTKKR